MTQSKGIASLFLVILMLYHYQQHPLVGCNSSEDSLDGINRMLSELTVNFVGEIKKIFYDKLAQAEADENFPLISLSAQMVEIEAILYAIQVKALFVAQDIVVTYLITKRKQLNEILVANKHLVDMIVHRLREHALDNGLTGIRRRRKMLYLQLRMYEDEPGVRSLALEYFQSLARIDVELRSARDEYANSLERYKSQAPSSMSADYAWRTARCVDQLICDTVIEMDRDLGVERLGEGMEQEDLLKMSINPEILKDVRMAELKAIDKVEEVDENLLSQLTMQQVLAYENQVIDQHDRIGLHIAALNDKLAELQVDFTNTIQTIFHNQQQLARDSGNYVLMALSAEMAESELLSYANERRMLLIIKDIINQHRAYYSFEINMKPIQMLVGRLAKYSTEQALGAIASRRKSIYLMTINNDQYPGVKDLARAFARRINGRSEKMKRIEMQCSHLIYACRSESSPGQWQAIVNIADKLMHQATEVWRQQLETLGEAGLMQLSGEPRLYEQIQLAQGDVSNRVRRPEPASIEAISMEQIWDYELGLILSK